MMKTVRMSRKDHANPRMSVGMKDISGLRGTDVRSGSVLRDMPKPPKKPSPFKKFPRTMTLKTDEEGFGKEGPGGRRGTGSE